MTPVDYSIVVVYLAGMVLMGLYFQRKASAGIDSYFLGNRNLPWWALGASGMASNLDVAGTMINTAWIFAIGAAGMFIEIRGGVTLIMAFLMIFMGKWNRRARVMTMAEWMHFRFGKGKEGDVARLMSAVSILVVTIAMITYFAVGAGKFISTFLGIPDVGRIEDRLDEREAKELEAAFTDLFRQIESLGVSMEAEKPAWNAEQVRDMETSWKILTAAGEQFDAAWSFLRKEKDKLPNIVGFDNELNEFYIAAKSFQMAAEDRFPAAETIPVAKAGFIPESSLSSTDIEKTPYQEPEGTPSADQAEGFQKEARSLVIEAGNLKTLFTNSVSFRIILKAQFLAALLMITLAMIYTVASGLYGVIWTDVFQGVLIFGTIIFICYTAFAKFIIPQDFFVSVPVTLEKENITLFQAIPKTRDAWTSVLPQWRLNFPGDYSIYNMFGIAILFYLIKVTIEGAGGTSGYMIQRFFASRSDRDAGLLSLFWTFLLSFRWPFIAAIAVMGVSYGAQHGVISDPETVLPVVVSNLIRTPIKGLLVAGLMAAAMSTFDSTVNAGASYWVKDIYQAYINPGASQKRLMIHSRVASIVIVILGLLFSLTIKNINQIWGWITMSIGAGMIVPTLVRWYWWRMNGWGFALGTAAGMVAAVVQRMAFPNVPEYVSFMFASGISFLTMVIGTYATRPTDPAVLDAFYRTTRPFGFWKPVRRNVNALSLEKVDRENRRDKRSIFLAVPWQIVLFLMWIAVMMKRWDNVFVLLAILIVLSVGLYFSWFRHLSTEVHLDKDEQPV
jgi:Na+/proline symporter